MSKDPNVSTTALEPVVISAGAQTGYSSVHRIGLKIDCTPTSTAYGPLLGDALYTDIHMYVFLQGAALCMGCRRA